MRKAAVKRKIKTIVEFIAECLAEKGVKAEQIVVFGSQANGDAGKDSDLDIIIVSNMFKGKSIFERVEMVSTVHSKTLDRFMMPLDIVLKTPEEAKESHLFNNGVVVWAA